MPGRSQHAGVAVRGHRTDGARVVAGDALELDDVRAHRAQVHRDHGAGEEVAEVKDLGGGGEGGSEGGGDGGGGDGGGGDGGGDGGGGDGGGEGGGGSGGGVPAKIYENIKLAACEVENIK